jgi:ribose/xylose/arabinose/galactoside ABC-type transport system permease subunit
MFIVFSIFGKSFLGVRNILNIFMQSAVYGVMAMGMTFLIICGYFDLSAGVVMGFIANMVILFQINGLSIPVSILLVLLVSVAIGSINGLLVTRVNINAFIVTLATMLSIRGFTYFLCNGDQISNTERLFARYANRSFFGVS